MVKRRKKAKIAHQKRGRDIAQVPDCPECGEEMVATMVVTNRKRMRWKCSCGESMPIHG